MYKPIQKDLILQRVALLFVSGILMWILLAFIQWNGNPGAWNDAFRLVWVVGTLFVFSVLVQKGDNRYYREGEKLVAFKGDAPPADNI
jgi:uncharacterized membrane protein YhaH (DUF805 family)